MTDKTFQHILAEMRRDSELKEMMRVAVKYGFVCVNSVVFHSLDAATPTSWTCACGWTNGIGLSQCGQCLRKPGYNWETREDNPCTQQ